MITSPKLNIQSKGDHRMEVRGDFYWDEANKPYVRVTHITDVLPKPQLEIWKRKQTYYATIADPTIGENKAIYASDVISGAAANRGSAVHSIIEVYKHGTDFEAFMATVTDELKPYAKAFWHWVQDKKPEFKMRERFVKSEQYGYAGTMDILAVVDGKLVIIDAKTSKMANFGHWCQVAAYRQALREEGQEVDGVYILLLHDNGTYEFVPGQGDMIEPFLAALTIWKYMNAELLEQLTQRAQAKKGNGNGKADIPTGGPKRERSGAGDPGSQVRRPVVEL
jgi:hypothetical protein